MSDEKIDNRKDLILLLIYAPGAAKTVNEPIEGRTRMIKLLFLAAKELFPQTSISKRIRHERTHSFFAHHYGPFSKDVYDDIVFLENTEYVEEKGGESPTVAEIAEYRLYLEDISFSNEQESPEPYFRAPKFCLTEKGLRYAEKLHKSLSPQDQMALSGFKTKYNSIPLRALINYVYGRYQEYAEKSLLNE